VVIRDTAFDSMGAVEPLAWMSAAARRWLENTPGRALNALPLSGVRVSLAEGGRTEST
jgi:acyl-coenzyme A thioesterase 13